MSLSDITPFRRTTPLIDDDDRGVVPSDPLQIIDYLENRQSAEQALGSWASVASIGPRCNYCGNPTGSDAVFYKQYAFHKNHFVCKMCGTQLVHPIEIYGSLYCLGCSLNMKKQEFSCAVCGAPRSQSSVAVAGKCFCRHHFVCVTCKKPLTLESFRLRGDLLYCPEHIPHRLTLVCTGCKKELNGPSLRATNLWFHPSCFNCRLCGTNLSHKPYIMFKQRPVCQKCYKKIPLDVKKAL